MPTPAERRALLFLAALAALGLGVRGVAALHSDPAPPTVAERDALARQRAAVDSATVAERSGKRGRGTRGASGRAATTPKVATKAPRDSANRSRLPSLSTLDPREKYWARREAVDRYNADVSERAASGEGSRAASGERRGTTSNERRATRSGPTGSRASVGIVDLDVASAAEIEALPGIGPALAGRIVADRTAHGPFGSLDGLTRVRGVGPALADRLQPLVTFSLPPRPESAEESPKRPRSRRRPGV
jgi:DNA uptake protein ComE-like DNA-binding protein